MTNGKRRNRPKIKKYNSELIRVIAVHLKNGNKFRLGTNRREYYKQLIERDLEDVQIINTEEGIEVSP